MTAAIPSWNERFETAQSRKVIGIGWVPIRFSFINSLRAQPPEVAATMVQIVFLAATMPKRGVLHDGGAALTLEGVAACVGASSELVAKASSALGVNWERASSLEREGGKERGRSGGKKKASPSFVAGHPAYDVAKALQVAVKSHSPNSVAAKNGEEALQKWAKDIDLAMRRDGRSADDLMRIVQWAHHDDPRGFWRGNLMSGKKLREHFDRLALSVDKSAGSILPDDFLDGLEGGDD